MSAKHLVVTLALLASACGGSPTEPTSTSTTPTTVVAPAPEPAPPTVEPAPAPPVPTPPPVPMPKAWRAETGTEWWIPGRVDPLDGHFLVRWDARTLYFDRYEADIVTLIPDGIFATLGAWPRKTLITIQFDRPDHALWSWDSADGQAYGEMVYR